VSQESARRHALMVGCQHVTRRPDRHEVPPAPRVLLSKGFRKPGVASTSLLPWTRKTGPNSAHSGARLQMKAGSGCSKDDGCSPGRSLAWCGRGVARSREIRGASSSADRRLWERDWSARGLDVLDRGRGATPAGLVA